MTDVPDIDAPETPRPPPPPRRPPPWRLLGRVGLWIAEVVGVIVAFAIVAILLLNTSSGRRLIVDEIGRHRLPNGLALQVGRIDGSIYGRMVLRDVTVSDLRGPFLRTPALTLDWRPLALLSKHVDLNELSADSIDLLRRPVLKAGPPPKPGQPVLPSISITLSRLRIGTFTLEPPVIGSLRRLTLAGSADLVHRRARVDLDAQALRVDGQAGGDRLLVKLDAEPDRNRLFLEAHANGPADGIIAGLARVRAPISLDLGGRGTWRLWRGRVDARVGPRLLLGADLAEASGVYSARGQAAPGLLMKGLVAAMADPSAAFDVTGSVAKKVLSLQGRFVSPQASVALNGGVGLADSTLRKMQARVELTRPQALSPRLTGEGVVANLVLNGPFARPAVDYVLAARRLGIAGDVLEAVNAKGRVQLGAGSRLQLEVHGAAARLSAPGKPGSLVTDIRLDGKVAGVWTGAVTGRIDLRSSAVNLTADVSGSTRSNRYAATATGRLETPGVRALGLESVLGGPASFQAALATAPGVTVQVQSLQLTSPGLKVTRAEGVLRADGGLSLQAEADSTAYGPLTLTAGGSLKSPNARLIAAHPNIGIQLTNLDAQLTRPGPAYRIVATAGTPYGPFAADLALTLGAQLAVDIQRASVDGLVLAGHLVRTPEGPFSGALTLTGEGLNGQARLSPQGAIQEADLVLRAHRARLPLNPALTIGGGIITGHAVLTPGTPSITARAELVDVGQGSVQLATARLNLDYRNGVGRAALLARGAGEAPFDLASTASMTPTAIRIDIHGSANRIAFHLQRPAEIVKVADGWRLEPASLMLPSGRLDASGSFGRGYRLSLRLEQVDLGMSQGFAPQLGLGGTASGSVDLTAGEGSAMPEGRAVLQFTGVTRSGLVTVSEPVDMNVLASLGASGADFGAVLRRRGAVIGRLQARLTPAATGQSWMARLQAGTVSGGIRYDGPAEALWAVSGVSGQEIAGPIAIGADVSGRLDAPELRGIIRANDLRYQNTKYGTRFDNLAIQGTFSGTRLELVTLSGKAGSGTLQGSGYVDLSLANGLPVDLKLALDRAQLARSSDLSAALTGNIRVTNSRRSGGLISGDLRVNNARYAVERQASTEVVELQGVRRKGQPLEAEEAENPVLPASHWKLDVRVRADNQILVSGMGLNSEWRADLRISGDLHHPVVVGDVTSIRGTYAFGGRQLELTDGVIHLDGESPPNPTLAITASATVNDVTATINVAGTARDPQITFTSSPSLPQDEVLSRLLFGASTPQLSPLQAVQLAASLNALRGRGGGMNPLGKLGQAVGVQNLTFTAGAGNQGAGVGVGKYIGNRIYVQVSTDTKGLAVTQIQIALTRALSLLSQVSSLGTSNLSLRYSHRY
jgi:translocation and assembly module TamB